MNSGGAKLARLMAPIIAEMPLPLFSTNCLESARLTELLRHALCRNTAQTS